MIELDTQIIACAAHTRTSSYRSCAVLVTRNYSLLVVLLTDINAEGPWASYIKTIDD